MPVSTFLRHWLFKKLGTKLETSALVTKDAKYITSSSAKFYDDHYSVEYVIILKSFTVY